MTRIANMRLHSGGTVESYRWARKMLGSKPNPGPMLSRNTLIRTIKTRKQRRCIRNEGYWTNKIKRMGYAL